MPTDLREHALTCLREDRIMAVLRQVPFEHLVPLADLLVERGVRSLEITHDYDRATDDVALLVERFGDAASVGVGTTWTVEQAESAAAAGATFCVLPGVDVATVAKWAGHRDGGVLILRTYTHTRQDHSLNEAKRVRFD